MVKVHYVSHRYDTEFGAIHSIYILGHARIFQAHGYGQNNVAFRNVLVHFEVPSNRFCRSLSAFIHSARKVSTLTVIPDVLFTVSMPGFEDRLCDDIHLVFSRDSCAEADKMFWYFCYKAL